MWRTGSALWPTIPKCSTLQSSCVTPDFTDPLLWHQCKRTDSCISPPMILPCAEGITCTLQPDRLSPPLHWPVRKPILLLPTKELSRMFFRNILTMILQNVILSSNPSHSSLQSLYLAHYSAILFRNYLCFPLAVNVVLWCLLSSVWDITVKSFLKGHSHR